MNETRGIDKTITVFDMHAGELMQIDVLVGNTPTKMDLLKELMFDDRDLADYTMLFSRMKKLPALLTFYGMMKDRAGAVAAALEDDYDIWFAQESEKARAELVKSQEDLKSSLMKAPTIADIKGRVALNNPDTWRQWRDKQANAQDRVAVLSRLLEGLQASVRLVGSESSLLQALINKGIEVVSNPGSRWSGGPEKSQQP